jgi:hypothetical protein
MAGSRHAPANMHCCHACPRTCDVKGRPATGKAGIDGRRATLYVLVPCQTHSPPAPSFSDTFSLPSANPLPHGGARAKLEDRVGM